jgi:hypothetical protein
MPVLSRPFTARGFVAPLLSVSFASMIIVLGDIPADAQTVSTPTLSANPVPPVPNPCPAFRRAVL